MGEKNTFYYASECERSVKKVFKNIPEGKRLLESQERDGWAMFKVL
jgi:hypothetical protein